MLAAALVVVWQRWRAASPATRRVLAPMYATGGAAIGVLLIVVTLLQIAGVAGSTVTFYAFCVSFTAIPVGYLFGILRTRLDQGSAVHTLLATLRGQRTTGGLRDALRVTLNDPTLELGLPARRHRRVPRRARRSLPAPAAAPTAPRPRSSTTASRWRCSSTTRSCSRSPGLIDAVCGPAAIAIENERLQAELRAQIQEVSASERRLRDVLENVHLAAVSLDRDGRITFANQYLAELTGWTRAELVGSTWLERFPTGDPHYVDRLRAERIRVHDEMPLPTRSGDERTISWSNTLDRDADGAVCGTTSIGEDVDRAGPQRPPGRGAAAAGDDGRRRGAVR